MTTDDPAKPAPERSWSIRKPCHYDSSQNLEKVCSGGGHVGLGTNGFVNEGKTGGARPEVSIAALVNTLSWTNLDLLSPRGTSSAGALVGIMSFSPHGTNDPTCRMQIPHTLLNVTFLHTTLPAVKLPTVGTRSTNLGSTATGKMLLGIDCIDCNTNTEAQLLIQQMHVPYKCGTI